jgi:hypothetical protein
MDRVKMKKNMGTIDRAARTLAAVAVGVLYATGRIDGTLATVLAVFAVVFLVTSSIAWCPMYVALGVSTRRS